MSSYIYVGTYDTAGRSEYANYDYNGPLFNQSAFTSVDPLILTEIITKLPEGVDNITANPSFLKDGDILVTSPTTFKITFLFDGAGGFTNTLGYYFYTNGTTITTASDLGPIYIIYPNYSQTGGGGIYNAGDSMLLGSAFSTTVISGLTIGTPTNLIFPANTRVGFVLIQNAWNSGTATVSTGNTKFYTLASLNPSANIYRFNFQSQINPAYIITSFEDTVLSGSDRDVNDVIFLVIPGNFNNIDTSTINLASGLGGDPHIKTLNNNYLCIDNEELQLIHLENDKITIDIKGYCDNINLEDMSKKNKYHRNGNGFIRPINQIRESYYFNTRFLTRLTILYKVENIAKTLEIDTIDLKIISGDLEYEILKPTKGLYSLTYRKNYALTDTTKELAIPIGNYKLYVKTDTFWDETNEIQFYCNSLREFKIKDGLWLS
jgi:hypothetical protein